jgi:hypothetical protein
MERCAKPEIPRTQIQKTGTGRSVHRGLLCTHPALIIELDGPIHDFTINEDAERTEAITDDHNIPVLRVKNEEVLGHLPQVLKKMEQLLLSASSPSLLPMGGEGSTVMINRNFCSIIPRFPSLPQRERGGSAEPE